MPFVARAVDTAMTSVASTKRDGANDDIANAVVRLPEIVARVATGVQQSIENAKRWRSRRCLNLVANAPRLFSDVLMVSWKLLSKLKEKVLKMFLKNFFKTPQNSLLDQQSLI